jgi:acyl carrier protein
MNSKPAATWAASSRGTNMRNKDIDQIVLDSIKQVAPEVPIDNLQAELPFRDQFEFDSVDFLKFILKLQEETGGKISELDFSKLSSLQGCRNYLGTASTA